MKKKIASILIITIFLAGTLSIAFIIRPSFAENCENTLLNRDFLEKTGETSLPNKANKLDQTEDFDSNWYNIFERKPDAKQDKTLESPSQISQDYRDKWNFNDTSEWSNFAYADGNKTRLIVGVNREKLTSFLELEKIAAKHRAKIVNTVSIRGEVKAVVVELLFASVGAFVEEIRIPGFASYVEPNMKVQAQFVPNDPYWSIQWGPQKIEADWAWNTTLGDASVLVAVIDTGIDYTHLDLAANYVALGYDWVNIDADPIDDHGHGTHCAGIIAATLNNSEGIAGLAQVRVMAEKVLDSGGWGYWDWIASGIIHATDCGADTISMSLGGYGESELLHEALTYAYDAGVLVIAAAGNENTNMKLFPAGYEEVVAVAATDQYDMKASWSNWGDWIELAAPGVDIYSTVPWGYESLSGTSMACPHVAGVAALVWSMFPNKTRDWVRLWLRYTADDLGDPGFDIYYGYGRVNARKAVEQSPPAHELIAYEWRTPPYVEPEASGTINATILNFGENNETDVMVQLLANDIMVDSTLIGFLASGNSTTVNLSWNPTVEGLCNVTLYVVPVPSEASVENNVAWKYIYVGFPVKAVVLHSAGNVYGEIITNWQVLNSEWHLFGDTMVYVDYATLNKEGITYEDIVATEADVLLISCAHDPYAGWQFTDSEIEAIKQYVHEGHGLIATAGTLYHWVPNNNKLAPLFGLNETTIWDITGTDLLHVLNTTNPLFTDVPNPLVFPYVGSAIPFDWRWDLNELVGGTYVAKGQFEESAIVTYRGLVYISPWLEVIPPYYHHHLQLIYNAIIWSCYQKPEHDIAVSLEAPKYLEPGESMVLNATVSNLGLNNETDVGLMLLIDGATANSTTISELTVGASYTLNYLWIPTVEKAYNVTTYAQPLLDEEFTSNNFETKIVRVMFPMEVAVLGDYQSQLTNLLWENGIVAYEKDWDIVTDIYEYDVVIINRPSDPGASMFLALIEAADEHRVGLVFTSSWPGSGESYGISLLQWYVGDPEGQGHTYGQGSVYYQVVQEHPIFEGWNIGDQIYIITSGDRDHAWFWGYSGEVIADIGADLTGIRGGGIAYKILESGNKHLLLAGLAPQSFANTIHWTEKAKIILVQGVLWASKPVLYEHDLSVTLEAPKYQIPNNTVVLNATVRNRGLNNETDVELFLQLEGEIINYTSIPQLPIGASQTLTYSWVPTVEGTYNITAYAPPVENETFVTNNKATKSTTVIQPLIHPLEGQYANYTIYYIDPDTGEEIFGGLWNFTYLHYVSPYQINVTTWMRDPYNYTQSGWMIVNIFTRIVEKDSGIYWTGMWYPGWIETNVTIGSTINLMWENGTIVDNKIIYVEGRPIDCWEIRLEYYGYTYVFWYDKASGLWIGMMSASPYGVQYLMLTATNVPIGFMYEHDLAVMLDAPTRLSPGANTILNATVYNTGLSNEANVTLQLAINSSIVASEVIPELASGGFYTLSYPWTPSVEGLYNVTVSTPPILGEEYIENNVRVQIVNVQIVTAALISDHSELLAITYILDSIGINYDIYNSNNIYFYTADLDLLLDYRVVIFYTDYRGIKTDEQAALNSYLCYGGNLIVTGFDCLVSDTRLADVVRSSTVGDNVGQPDLYVVDATHPIMNGSYGSFPVGYHIMGLYSDCDRAEADVARGAVAVAKLADGYEKIIATDLLPGKVVFWNGRGDYDWKGNLDCQAMFKNMIDWTTVRPEHDLAVSLEAPDFLAPGNATMLNATVCNSGLSNETDVELQMWINGVMVDDVTIPELTVGAYSTLSYPWAPTTEGIYNITAYAHPVLEEELTANNVATKFVYVGLPPGATIVYVSPPFINITAGEMFTVNISIANVSELFGYEFKMFYNAAVLNCANVTLPPSHFLEPEDPDKLFIVKLEFDNEYNATHGRVLVAMTLLSPEVPKNGSGTLVTVSFRAIAFGESALDLSGTKLAKYPDGAPIAHVALDGYVTVEAPAALRDIALIEVVTCVDEVYEGWIVQISVTAKNLGNVSETFDVTVYYGNNSIETQTITNLASSEETTLIFNWNTSGVELYVNHTIWAEASMVPEEINLDNNICTNGTVKIKILGDINCDGVVDIFDIVLVGLAFGTQPGDLLWNSNVDSNQDGIIDLFDIVIIALNLGLEY